MQNRSLKIILSALFGITIITCLSAMICNPSIKAVSPKLILPEGFNGTIVADDLGNVRHITVSENGNIFVKLERPIARKGVLMLREKNNVATVQLSFGNYRGSGIYLKNGYLYTSSNEEVYRYKLNEKNEVVDSEHPEKIVTGLIGRRQHEAKAILLDDQDNLYVNIGAYSNSCQIKDRQKGSPGQPGCPILDSAGGIWQFKASRLNQTYKDGIRYATGLRNVMGFDWNKENDQLFAMQHGRDGLFDLWPEFFDAKQSAILPAECLYALKKGDNAGWPYIYYDQVRGKQIIAPEYGGNGKKEGDQKFLNPVVAFPGHLAPNALLFYTGDQFPSRYKNGAFIAFHGSWNRAPEPQAGYFVVFQPFKNGKPDGKWEVFADGFSGSPANTADGHAEHRPCGLAQGPDGSLYISDDVKGTIYKITYKK